MDLAKDADQLLKAMYDHEIALSRLYGVYAAKFDDYKDFWLNLSEEEMEHANCIDLISQKVKGDSELIVVDRFSIAAIEASIKYVKKLIDKAEDPDFELLNALSQTLHLEEAMIENNFFEVFEGDGPQAVRVLNLLSTETREHLKKIKTVLEQYKQAEHGSA